MSHYKRYTAYKESGVEWIGHVPEHWTVCKLNFRFSVELGKMLDQKRISGVHLVPYLRNQDVQWESINSTDLPAMDIAPDEYERYTAIAGDLLVCEGGDVGRAAIWQGEPIGYQKALHRLRPRRDDQPQFMLASLIAAKTMGVFAENDSKATISHLPAEAFRNYRFPFPPPSEQSAICSAFARETARIDALIAKKTGFLELLKEKRQALITHAVTKGLDPNVRMKDSGVAWIGAVPEHWEVSKLAYTTREAGGKTPDTKNEAYWGGDVPWVSPKDMKQSEIIGAIDTISDTAVKECGMRLFAPGAILAVVRGMILAHSFPVATLAIPATINQDMKALEPDTRIRANYLRLILEAAKDYVVSVLVAEAAHGTRVLRTDVWRQLPALIPPLDEQDAILAELDRITARHEKLTDRVKESIALLKERRSALITAAVTGQIDLREDAA
ncbi:restriction endonuclease subunit S [Silanimonas sp.]|uniref:restriction endonuclease subunit S n=1 Tax=Silanimonas sp. TaxID=1929290 RepID=UPI0022CA4D87|nr:restriction endonuclease subunit S [Silanimonas sp.]MCZ8061388.1 restriction endonuclease subunit S [Silanimonas sp.]